MWMVESNEQMRQVEMPTDGRKLRPLMPRHIKTTCCCLPNPNNILHWTTTTTTTTHHHPITCCLKSQVPLVSSRWNPTPEQLQALEEMYRRGIRTPSAEQIQQIAAKLTRFGKIQGKNVFYWFQNHKARERQKKRRQLESKPALSRRTYIENEHHNKLGTPSKCSTPSEDSESMQAAVIGIGLHHKISNETQSLSLSPNNPSPKGPPPINININPPSTTNNIFPALQHNININKTTLLQLFPLHDAGVAPSATPEICHAPPKFVPNEFIEFLPTKN